MFRPDPGGKDMTVVEEYWGFVLGHGTLRAIGAQHSQCMKEDVVDESAGPTGDDMSDEEEEDDEVRGCVDDLRMSLQR